MALYVRIITVQHPAVTLHHSVFPETLIPVFRWLNIVLSAFTLLVAGFTKGFWKDI